MTPLFVFAALIAIPKLLALTSETAMVLPHRSVLLPYETAAAVLGHDVTVSALLVPLTEPFITNLIDESTINCPDLNTDTTTPLIVLPVGIENP